MNRPMKKHTAKQSKKSSLANQKNLGMGRRALFYATVIALMLYTAWRIFFTLPFEYGVVNIIMGVLLLAAEMSGFFQMVADYRQLIHYMEPELPQIPTEWYPDVDILVATHNESVELLYKTLNGATFLRYPDKSRVHIYLCDDQNRPEMAQLAAELGVGYFGLEGNKDAKAGNLNNALSQTRSPLVATFDADMIPHNNFLMDTVPYFFLPRVKKTKDGTWVVLPEDEVDDDFRIGYIQTPQSFYNPDLFQYYLYSEGNIPNEQDYFFREVNVAHNYDNAPIYAGSNTILARAALDEVDLIATNSITEDFMTGIRIQKKGYRNYAISKPLAHGLAPDRIKSLLNQRERWARGNIQTMRREHVLLTPHLSLRQKLSNFSSFMYWQGYIARMLFILAPIVQVLFNMRFLDAAVWQILVFWLPAYLLYNRSLRVLSGNITNQHWSNVVDTIFAPYLCGPVLFEDFGISKRKFVVTDKEKRVGNKRWRTAMFCIPHLLMLIACAVAIIVTVQQSFALRTLYNPIVLYWLIVGFKNLLFAVFFMFGRSNVRFSERFYVQVPVTIQHQGESHEGITHDISETGMAVVLDKPAYLPSDIPIQVSVRAEQYIANMKCVVISVVQVGKSWKYGLRISEMDDENKRQYMQVVYDRQHTLPIMLSPNASVFNDINTNLMQRTRRRQANKRKLPRLEMHLPFQTTDGRKGTLLDFNFEYAALSLDFQVRKGETLSLNYGPGLVLVLQPATDISSHSNSLFKVANMDEMLERPDFERMLEDWLALQDIPPQNKPVGQAFLHSNKT